MTIFDKIVRRKSVGEMSNLPSEGLFMLIFCCQKAKSFIRNQQHKSLNRCKTLMGPLGTDDALMMHLWSTDDALMLYSWNINDDALMMQWRSTVDALMMPWWCTDDALMMHWWCTDDALMMYWWCTDDALTMHWVWYDAHRSGFWPSLKVLWR